jgi:alkylation response protein AidB-like acyl-CoA dehydrogenase
VSQAATFATPTDVQAELVETIRRFVEREVVPVASKLDHDNEYPHQLVARMRELGLFGATIPTEYGGLGLDVSTYAMIIEELCVGWMTLSGILNTHLLLAYMIRVQGTDDQKQRYLSKMAKGEFRGALCLTESHAGSDVQNIRTTATRRGDDYVVNGSKMFVTNGREGSLYALVCKTDPKADRRTRA